MKVKELLNSEDKWCRLFLAKNSAGGATGWSNKNACKWCLVGAIFHCYGYDRIGSVTEEILAKVRKEIGAEDNESIGYYNDNYNTTTFSTIKELVNKLDI